MMLGVFELRSDARSCPADVIAVRPRKPTTKTTGPKYLNKTGDPFPQEHRAVPGRTGQRGSSSAGRRSSSRAYTDVWPCHLAGCRPRFGHLRNLVGEGPHQVHAPGSWTRLVHG